MGEFIGVFAASLREEGNTFVQGTEVLDFPDEVWIYYCRPHLGQAPQGWLDLAEDTLRVSLSSPPMRHVQLTWEPLVAPQEENGAFQYAAAQFGLEQGNNLFHLALPPYFLPIATSWDIAPLYGHADGSRFVVGWGGQADIWPTMSFKRVEPDNFSREAKELEWAIERQAKERRKKVLNPWGQGAQLPDTVFIYDRLNERLNLSEVKTLAFRLGIDYENLGGETKSDKLRELLIYMGRQDQLPRLVAQLNLAYSHVLRP